MKIKSLKLTDFKGFEELHIESFGKKTTAIIGNNGAGKSSVIQALEIIYYWVTKKIWLDKYYVEIIRNNSETETAYISVELDIGSKIFNPELFYSNHKHIPDIGVYEAIYEERKKLRENTGNTCALVIYSPSRLINNYSFYEEKNEEAIDYESESTLNFRFFFNWFEKKENYENEIRLNENNQFRLQELEALRKAYRIFFPGFEKLRIKRYSNSIGDSNFIFENDNKILFFKQLSDGEQGVIALIGDIVRRLSEANPKLDDPLQGEAIIMIDEIELHLHPTWQRKIIKKLEAIFPNCQFIITTHSPQVLSELDAENDKIIAIKDFKAYEIPTVFGRETNWILETVMDTPARPSEFKNQLRTYFDLIANNKLEKAETLRKELEAQTGSDEPEFVKADMLIRRKKAMKK